jgi:hypothetical protein
MFKHLILTLLLGLNLFAQTNDEEYELLFVIDTNISGMGLQDRSNPGFYEEFSLGAYYTYKDFQEVGIDYSIAQADERKEKFQAIFKDGYYNDDGSYTEGFINQLGLDPNNPDHFNEFVYAFATLLDNKPYDTNKNVNNVVESYGVIDALTTSRGGVCVDYAMWIGELLQYADVAGFDINQHFAPTSYATESTFHTLGGIKNPHTGEVLYINYGEVLIEKEGSLIPVNYLMDGEGFAGKHTGVLMRRGGVRGEDGEYIPTSDETTGIYLTPYGKTLQDIIYKNNGFDNLKLRKVTGVNQTEHATAGISLRKNVIKANKVQFKSWDLAVSYINLDPRYDGRNKKERILVFGKRRLASESEYLRQNFQVFMALGTGTDINSTAVLDIAYEIAPKVEFDLKFLSDKANLELSLPVGVRGFAIGESLNELIWEKEQVNRDMLNIYNSSDEIIGTYNSTNGNQQLRNTENAAYIKDPDTGEKWSYADRGVILPYYYQYTGDQVEEKTMGFDGFFRMTAIPTAKMRINENFSIRASAGLVIAPTPNNISSWRGKEVLNPRAYDIKTAPIVNLGATYRTKLGNGEVRLHGNYRKDFSPYGAMDLYNVRAEYVTQNQNTFYTYFTKSKAEENFANAANNYVMLGAGYKFNNRVSLDASYVDYGSTELYQARINVTFGGGKKKKKRRR